MEYENDYISETKSESTENEMEKIRKLDKRYYSYTKKVFNDKKTRFKMFRIGMYATGNTNVYPTFVDHYDPDALHIILDTQLSITSTMRYHGLKRDVETQRD